MVVYAQDDFLWKGNKLFLKDELLGEVIEDKFIKMVFWVKWPNGDLSQDYYSLTRARDNLVKYSIRTLNIPSST
jgi:hypothetical protein